MPCDTLSFDLEPNALGLQRNDRVQVISVWRNVEHRLKEQRLVLGLRSRV